MSLDLMDKTKQTDKSVFQSSLDVNSTLQCLYGIWFNNTISCSCLVLTLRQKQNERNRSSTIEQTHRQPLEKRTSAGTKYDAASFPPKTLCMSLCVQIGHSRLLPHMTIHSPALMQLSDTHTQMHIKTQAGTHTQVAVISEWSPVHGIRSNRGAAQF